MYKKKKKRYSKVVYKGNESRTQVQSQDFGVVQINPQADQAGECQGARQRPVANNNSTLPSAWCISSSSPQHSCCTQSAIHLTLSASPPPGQLAYWCSLFEASRTTNSKAVHIAEGRRSKSGLGHHFRPFSCLLATGAFVWFLLMSFLSLLSLILFPSPTCHQENTGTQKSQGHSSDSQD